MEASIYIRKWKTVEVEKMIEFIKEFDLVSDIDRIFATGGGAHKFEDLICKELGVDI